MDKNFEEFKAKVQKRNAPRCNRIKNSVGVRQGFLFLQKRKWVDVGQPLTEKQFQQIIRGVNKALSDVFIEKKILTFPYGMGVLEARATSTAARYGADGKLIIPKPIDWDATLKLWYEDPEAMEKKVLIRSMQPSRIVMAYQKPEGPVVNKNYFTFYPNRAINRTLATLLREGTIETFLV